MAHRIRFNVPFVAGNELDQIARCLATSETSGDGAFSKECQRVYSSSACRAARAAHELVHFGARDRRAARESSSRVTRCCCPLTRSFLPPTRSCCGARPSNSSTFGPIRLNLDERLLRGALSPSQQSRRPGALCRRRLRDGRHQVDRGRARASVVEDAAQAVNSTYAGAFLGTLGHLGAYSFHATKNFSCGEGGALLVNDAVIHGASGDPAREGHQP